MSEGIQEVPTLIFKVEEVVINMQGMRLTMEYSDLFKLPRLTLSSKNKGDITFINVSKLAEAMCCPICGKHPVFSNTKTLSFECECFKTEGKVRI